MFLRCTFQEVASIQGLNGPIIPIFHPTVMKTTFTWRCYENEFPLVSVEASGWNCFQKEPQILCSFAGDAWWKFVLSCWAPPSCSREGFIWLFVATTQCTAGGQKSCDNIQLEELSTRWWIFSPPKTTFRHGQSCSSSLLSGSWRLNRKSFGVNTRVDSAGPPKGPYSAVKWPATLQKPPAAQMNGSQYVERNGEIPFLVGVMSL